VPNDDLRHLLLTLDPQVRAPAGSPAPWRSRPGRDRHAADALPGRQRAALGRPHRSV